MNERIRELARRSGAHISIRNLASNPVQHIEFIELCDDKIEKFAKLIVEECAGIYCKIDNGNLHMDTDDYLEALHKTFRS
jgi:hypothetical protein